MNHHILVVDDEPDMESLIRQRFRREIRQGEYQFSFASNGGQAYQRLLQQTTVDMVLTDINMPVMDGIELLRQINQLENPPKTVVLSASTDMASIRAAMNNGAFDFVTKPIDAQDLTVTVARTIKAISAEKAHQEQFKRTQMQLIQGEKLSSLGQMVAGVAHEINNPVNFIYGNLNPAKNYFQDLMSLIEVYQACYPNPLPEVEDCIEDIDLYFLQEDLAKLLDSLKLGANRIRDIVLSLKNFSRLDEAEKKTVALHEGIESTLLLLNNRLKQSKESPRIDLVRDYVQLPDIDCYPSQLNQVLMNLLANSIDALESSREGLSAQEIADNPQQIKIHTSMMDEQWVRIAIADNGPGMSEHTLANLFDPFFTTKPIGQGTGLGLSISYQIVVEKHKGKLYCESTLGKGSEFVIELPIH